LKNSEKFLKFKKSSKTGKAPGFFYKNSHYPLGKGVKELEIITNISKMQKISWPLLRNGETVGLVPTMGYLHEGHISLIKRARKNTAKVITSIFVNPIQFGPKEDYANYPRDMERDTEMAKKAGTDYIFVPGAKDMYPMDFATFAEVKEMDSIMCGAFRPGHFRGVCTVVLKLFNIIHPSMAYFGLKDYQQYLIIKKMSAELNLQVKIIGCPIIREKDGLAMSSRNKYLTEKERSGATVLYRSLKFAKVKIIGGERDLLKLQKSCINNIKNDENVSKIDYFDFRDSTTLKEIKSLEPAEGIKEPKKLLVATAVHIGRTRLIDNIVINIKNMQKSVD
jgi:pantoate--beta-alanine ligase